MRDRGRERGGREIKREIQTDRQIVRQTERERNHVPGGSEVFIGHTPKQPNVKHGLSTFVTLN